MHLLSERGPSEQAPHCTRATQGRLEKAQPQGQQRGSKGSAVAVGSTGDFGAVTISA